VGDRYYELDFRNMASNSDEESKETEKEQYIISIENKSIIDGMEYPGDNKLLVGTADKSLFVTAGGKYIDLSPTAITSDSTNSTIKSDSIAEETRIDEIRNATVYGALTGTGGTEIDFENNRITTDNLVVTKSMSYPRQTITN
jgi:hypothetical protein